MNQELAVLLTIKKKFTSLINSFTEIINSSIETNYYINSYKTNQDNILTEYIEMYNNTFDEKSINETINELKNAVELIDKKIYKVCNHCFINDHIEDQFGRVQTICYCESCGLNKDIYDV